MDSRKFVLCNTPPFHRFVKGCDWMQGAHLLGYELEELGLQAVHLHSHLNQRRRLAALQRFKSGKPHLEPFVL